MQTASVAKAVLAAWDLEDAVCTVVEEGLINQTFLLSHGEKKYILQQLHPIFTKDVHLNIEALTNHLQEHRFCTPQLIPTSSGSLEYELGDEIWRVLSFVEGQTVSKVSNQRQAYEAGLLVGRFHQCLAGFHHDFIAVRDGVHDTNKHLTHLDNMLSDHPSHPLYKKALALANDIATFKNERLDFGTIPTRPSHGDLKNFQSYVR